MRLCCLICNHSSHLDLQSELKEWSDATRGFDSRSPQTRRVTRHPTNLGRSGIEDSSRATPLFHLRLQRMREAHILQKTLRNLIFKVSTPWGQVTKPITFHQKTYQNDQKEWFFIQKYFHPKPRTFGRSSF